jgi:small subunit ribosomal protein S18
MKRKVDCYFSKNQIKEIDYRNTDLLGRFLSGWGKIKPARETGVCAKHQRALSTAVKRARYLGLMPFVKR